MRTTTTRAFGLVLTGAALGLGTAACGRTDDRGTATARDGTIDSAAARNANPMTQDTAGDQSIAAVLATIDRSEIQSSRVALQKASAGSVKEYARLMIDEHLRTSQQLATIARNANLTIPDSTMLDQNLGFSTSMGGPQGQGSAGAMAGTSGAQTGSASGQVAAGGQGNVNAGGNAGAPGSSGSTAGGSTTGGGGNVGPTGANPQQGSGMAGAGSGQPTSAGQQAGMGADSAGGRMRGNATMPPEQLLREMHTDAQAAMARLRPLRGREFDRAYMDAQVAMHSKSLNALGNLSASARSQELRAHIDMVTRHVQEHLQRAQTIRQGLGGGSGSGRS